MAYYKRVLPTRLENRIHLIQYGFRYDLFANQEVKTLPEAGQPLQLVNIGSYQDKKNQIFLVEVARMLQERGCEL